MKEDIEEIELIWNQHIKSLGNHPDVLDITYAKKVFLGATQDELMKKFSQSVIERTDELRFMPDILFNYYFESFTHYIINYEHDEFDAPSVASCFVNLVEEKISSKSILDKKLLFLSDRVINHLNENLIKYNSAPDIYGFLPDKLKLLQNKIKNYSF